MWNWVVSSRIPLEVIHRAVAINTYSLLVRREIQVLRWKWYRRIWIRQGSLRGHVAIRRNGIW